MIFVKNFVGLVVGAAFLLGGCSKSADESAQKPKPAQTETVLNNDPALWLIQDADTKIYLFGTVHILKPGMKWQTPKFVNAVKSADMIFLEADLSLAEDGSLIQEVTTLGANRSSCDLRCILPDADEDKVYKFGDDLGMPPEMLDRLQPWMVGIMFQALYMGAHGYKTDNGVEKAVMAMADDIHTPLRYFETPMQQMRFFANLPLKDQTDFLIATVDSINEDPDFFDELIEDWAKGNVKGIAEKMSETDDWGSEIVYEALLANRNKAWVVELKKQMEEFEGTIFVAVGTAHLVGKDSVNALMKKQGFEVVRQ